MARATWTFHARLASDERRVGGHGDALAGPIPEPRRQLGRPEWRRSHASADDLLVELPGLLLRLDSQLSLQGAYTDLVLLEGRPPAAESGVEAHEAPVDRLLKRIERDQSQRRPERILCSSGLTLPGKQPGQGLDCQLPQPLSLGHEPVLEERPTEGEALQKVTR